MILIVEGIDRVGKSTFIRRLEERLDYKEFRPRQDIFERTKDCETAKCFVTLEALRIFDECNIDIVIDRFHISEYVYGMIDRKYLNLNMKWIDNDLSKMNCKIVFFSPENLEQSSEEHGKDLSLHHLLFKHFCASSKLDIIECKHGDIEMIVDRIEKLGAEK